MSLIALFVTLTFAHSLISRRLERTVVTAPFLFTAAGMTIVLVDPGVAVRVGSGWYLAVAELGLVLLLFADASRTPLGTLRSIRSLPVRLLSAGMLLTILLGALAALTVFPSLSIWEAGILAAILAPTDAGLGQIIVQSPRVPLRIRESLNVEAGLNDGLSVPFLLFFIAMGTAAEPGHVSLTGFIAEQLGIGTLIGAGIGLIGGWLLGTAQRRRWITPSWRQLGVVMLALMCLLASKDLGASMFIAAFVCGLVVQIGFPQAGRHSVEFTEQWGQLFNLAVFFLFGLLVGRDWHELELRHAVYAALSLTVVRMLPVALALFGTRLDRSTVLFMGWFGPRGLASIVLGLVYLEQQMHQPGEETIRLAVVVTVLCSIAAHGLTAAPGIAWYARRVGGLAPDAPELAEAG